MIPRLSGRHVVGGLVVCLVLVLLGAVAPAGAVQTAEEEPNDDRSQATDITPGSTVDGEIPTQDDVDWYAFEAEAGQAIELDVDVGPGSGLNFDLHDPDGEGIDDGGTRGSDASVQAGTPALETGTYYLRVSHWTGDGATEYSAEVRTITTSDREPNEVRERASDISVGERVEASITPGDVDWYAFEAEAGQAINLTGEIGPENGAKFNIRDPDDRRIGGVRGSDTSLVAGTTSPTSGTHFLRVSQWNGDGIADYEFTLETLSTTDREPNEDPGNATGLSLNTTVEDTVYRQEADWYAFDLEAGDSISIRGTGESPGGRNLNVLSPERDGLDGTNLGEGPTFVNTTARSSGTHYVRVTKSSTPGGEYTLEIRTNGTGETLPGETAGDDPDGSDPEGPDEDSDDGGLPVALIVPGVGVVLVVLVGLVVYVRRDGESD